MKWEIYPIYLGGSQLFLNHYRSKADQLMKLNKSSLSAHCFSSRKSLCSNFFLARMELFSIYLYLPYWLPLSHLYVRNLCNSLSQPVIPAVVYQIFQKVI